MGIDNDGYWQDRDEAVYLESWEFTRDEDRRRGIDLPDAHYIANHRTTREILFGGRNDPEPVMTSQEKVEAVDRYAINKAAKVGDSIECACCGKKLTKAHYQQAFCPPVNKKRGKRYVCKDRYHNATDASRAARANQWAK